jgi:glycosyltransferase involved in cell wall biosynthesis
MGKYGVKAVALPATTTSLEGSKLWSILICTITERKESLDRLLAQLKRQIYAHGLENRIEILLFSDNRDCSIGLKRNKLVQAATGTYINFIDDDDEIHKEYIKMIYDKLLTDADCVSLVGVRTENGSNPQLFIHSIAYDSYFDRDGIFYRPPNHLNPIKREKASQFLFPELYWKEDDPWALSIAKSGCLKTEAKIDEPYYFYNYKSKD